MHKFSANDIDVSCYPEPKVGGMQTGNIPNGIKVTHKASGIVVICDEHRHQHKNRAQAFLELDAKLEQLKKDV